jgi:hypothetical protein
LFYLTLVVLPGFAQAVRASILVPGDAAATAGNIRASAALFRLSFVSDLTASISFLLTAMALYLLLQNVNPLVAAAMVVFVVASVAEGSLNLLNQYTALTIATSDVYAHTFGRAGSDALTLLFTEMQNNGYRLGAIFFGPWLVPLGYLVIRSEYFPKALGVFLIIGCFGYLATLYITFLAPNAPTGITSFLILVGGIPEIVFMVWLLVRGVHIPAGRAPLAPAGAAGR